jgi:hypothetical protein
MTNLAAGAIGALLGAFAAFWLESREARKLAKGATRAVYIEMAGNLTAARSGAAGNPLGWLHQELYVAEVARLSAYLSPPELMAIAWAYALVPAGQAALATLNAGGGRKTDDPERALLEELVTAITPATTMLNRKVWSAKERAALERSAAAAPAQREEIREEEARRRAS